ncbi:cell surface protein [Mizugakiibacter sediminis]|uniref:Cell surface protein n=1 Tax=Mizugakiibacter sediminis TaxID=1475481 RepID=A0A0K8QMC9_9GAMM|nr:hypothetical protein [Mizugakiibacter sediminis]GAP66060.1 cell surface protein [Mizugakiibacter sediminis]
MNSKPRFALSLLCAALLGALGAQAYADGTTEPTPPPAATGNTEAGKLAAAYGGFAGSDANARALVDGLRDGTSITLNTSVTNPDGTTTTSATTFQPATGKMGYGEVDIALALAKDELAKLGITAPTAAQIEAALNGGTVTLADGSTQDLKGVLALRADGQGWGQIAKTLGVKLGAIVSASHTDKSQAGLDHGKPDSAGQVAKADRPEHPARPDRPERPQRPERPERPDHAGRPGG